MVAPFVWADNTCDFCSEGLQTSCRHGGLWGRDGVDGGQGEAVRVPQAQGTLVKLPVGVDSALLPSLLTLSDVFPTGHHCAATAGVSPATTVTVIGDGAVGLSAVLAARRLGAERIILMGRHKDRTDLGREFGATDVVAERGEEGIERVRELTGGGRDPHRARVRRAAAGHRDGLRRGPPRWGGQPGRGSPVLRRSPWASPPSGQHHPAPAAWPRPGPTSRSSSPTSSRAVIEPGKVFDRTLGLDDIADGYRAMADREALKVLVRPEPDPTPSAPRW